MIAQADVVVIGGGVHGASAAYHLARARKQVALIEKRTIASASSGASGGIIRCHYSNPAMVRLAHRAAERWPGLAEELGAPVDYVNNGLIVAVAGGSDAAHLERVVRMQQRAGVATQVIAPEEIRAWIPEFATEGLTLAAREADAGYADPYSASMAFAAKARTLGAQVYTETLVTGITVIGSRVTGVETDRGAIRTSTVVNCAGAWAARIAAMAGIDLPVSPGLLQMVAFQPAYEGWTRQSPTWLDLSTMTYCRPDASGAMLAGGGVAENAAIDVTDVDPDAVPPRPPVEFEAEIHENVVRRCPWAARSARLRAWSGPDGNSPDFHLIFGPVPGLAGYLQIVGGSGNSFKLAPATGEALAEYVTTGTSTYLDPHAFSVTRFADGRPFRGGYQMHIIG